MINLKAVGPSGDGVELSADPAGSVSDVVMRIYQAIWADVDEDEFERRWVGRYLSIIHPSGDGFLDPATQFDSVQEWRDGDHLSFIVRVATADEQAHRIRTSRLRRSKTKTELLPKQLRRTHFSPELLAKVTDALRQGRQLSGFHSLTCKIGSLHYQEESWSWTLLYDSNSHQFIWRHQIRGQTGVESEAWSTDAAFIDFWSQMSERSACAYAGLLLYGDRPEAALLEGTLTVEKFHGLL